LSKRGNSEGSLYQSGEGWRGYVWCTRPDGTRYRKYVRGKSYDEARRNWASLRDQASSGPVDSGVPKLAEFLGYWLTEIVEPNLAPKTYEKYEGFSRLHIIPYLGAKRIDKIQVKEIRQWLNSLATTCQCCAQGKDAARPEYKRRCCAAGKCCQETLSSRSRRDARDTLRAALTCAVEDETITRNPVKTVKTTKGRAPKPRRKRQAWTVDDARWFLESTWHAGEALYAAFVLVLVLGLRKGEVLGLAWEQVDLDGAELYVGEQLQRVGRRLIRREILKTETSEAPLPLPDLCIAAFKIRRKQQNADRARAGDRWVDSGLVFTTRHGTPIEPRNFNRSFDRCIAAARVPRITVHGTRKTCASLLAALDVHPRVAMRILRHSKIAVTMEIYTEAPSEATRDALRKLGDLLA
jgi:integrase